jgi:hypothetical protein
MGKISSSETLTGVIAPMLGPAEDVELQVLNSKGEVVSDSSKHVTEQGPVALNFQEPFISKHAAGIYSLLVKGFKKGHLAWQESLGRIKF